jgi:hypothetical protein
MLNSSALQVCSNLSLRQDVGGAFDPAAILSYQIEGRIRAVNMRTFTNMMLNLQKFKIFVMYTIIGRVFFSPSSNLINEALWTCYIVVDG